ncbi:MAG: hypothetical protein ACRDS0_08930 [Pseudonocardiaceae bacterium]
MGVDPWLTVEPCQENGLWLVADAPPDDGPLPDVVLPDAEPLRELGRRAESDPRLPVGFGWLISPEPL